MIYLTWILYVKIHISTFGKKKKNLCVISVPPAIQSEPIDSIEVKENEILVLECDATGNPRPSILWLRDGNEIEPDSAFQFSIDNSFLEVRNATVSFQKFNYNISHDLYIVTCFFSLLIYAVWIISF